MKTKNFILRKQKGALIFQQLKKAGRGLIGAGVLISHNTINIFCIFAFSITFNHQENNMSCDTLFSTVMVQLMINICIQLFLNQPCHIRIQNVLYDISTLFKTIDFKHLECLVICISNSYKQFNLEDQRILETELIKFMFITDKEQKPIWQLGITALCFIFLTTAVGCKSKM